MPPPFGCPKEMVHMRGVGLRFSNLKIRQKILLFGIVSIIMLCIVFALFYGMVVSHMVLNRAEEDMKGELDEITDFFDEMDLDISYRLRHLDTSITIQQLLTAVGQGQKTDEDWSADALLEDICIAEQIYSVSLYTMDGRFVTGNDPETNRVLHLSRAVREAVGETEGNFWQDDAVYSRAPYRPAGGIPLDPNGKRRSADRHCPGCGQPFCAVQCLRIHRPERFRMAGKYPSWCPS